MNSCFSSSWISEPTVSRDPNLRVTRLMIRTAQLKDLKGLAEVLTTSFHSPQGILTWLYPLLKLGIYEDLRSRLRACSSQSYYRCLVASQSLGTHLGDEEEILGTVEITLRSFTFWSTTVPKSPYIANLAVKPTHRRQGIARKLLLKCEQIALEWGFQELSLHVLDNNDYAKQLYFKSGYKLHRIESTWMNDLFKRPRRLLLSKKMLNLNVEYLPPKGNDEKGQTESDNQYQHLP